METDWKKVGSLRLAASQDRVYELHRLATMARSFGLEMHLLTPKEAYALFPYIDISSVLAAGYFFLSFLCSLSLSFNFHSFFFVIDLLILALFF